MTWGTQDYNVGGGTFAWGSGAYTVPAAGLYHVSATVQWSRFTGAGYWCGHVTVNGTNVHSVCGQAATIADLQTAVLTTIYPFSAGDVVAIRVTQDTGAVANIFSPGAQYSSFTVTRLRP